MAQASEWAAVVAGKAPEIRPLKAGVRNLPPYQRWQLVFTSRAGGPGGAATGLVLYWLSAHKDAPACLLVGAGATEAAAAALRKQGAQVALLPLAGTTPPERVVVDTYDVARWLRILGMSRVGVVGLGTLATPAAAAAGLLELTYLDLDGTEAGALARGRLPHALAGYIRSIPAVPPPESGKKAV